MYISDFNGIDVVFAKSGMSPKLIDLEKWFVYKGACF